MQLGIFAKTFPGTTAQSVLQAAADAGYSCVQFNMTCVGLPSMPLTIEPEKIAEINDGTAMTGVSIAALSGTYNMAHPDPIIRRDGLTRLKTVIAAAAQLSIPIVTLCTGSRHPHNQWRYHPDNGSEDAWRDMLAEMALAVRLAEDAGIRLGIEPELGNVVYSASRAAELLRTLKTQALTVVLDPSNLFELPLPNAGRDVIADAIDRLAGHIGMAHAKDRSETGDFVAVRKGVIDFPDFIHRLKQTGFDEALVTHGLEASEAPGVANYLRGLDKVTP